MSIIACKTGISYASRSPDIYLTPLKFTKEISLFLVLHALQIVFFFVSFYFGLFCRTPNYSRLVFPPLIKHNVSISKA